MPDTTAMNLSLLLLRVVLGAVFLAHGINHVFRGGKIPGPGRWFESLGMKPGVLHAWLASLTEIGAGALLLVGFLTPLAGAGVVGTMVVAWITNHLKNGFFIFRPGEGYEYVMTLAALGLVVAGLGAGEWSLDHVTGIFENPSMGGFLVALLAGGGGAVALLVAFWRPPARSPAQAD